jgi:hypothetical protein
MDKMNLLNVKQKMKDFINNPPTTADIGVQKSGTAMQAEEAIKKRKKELDDLMKELDKK